MKENRVHKTILSGDREPLRLLALSDGLFATVLTLLVLDLRLPEAITAAGGGVSALARWLAPHLFSYLMTFFVAGNYWLAHHRDFDHIIRYDRGLMGYNLLFLLFVGLFPFSTASLSQLASGPGSYSTVWGVYAFNLFLAGVMLTLIWLYAVSHGLVDSGTTRQESRYFLARQIANPTVFLVSAGVQFLFPRSYLGPWILLALFPMQILVDRLYSHGEPNRAPHLAAWPRRLWRWGILLIWLLVFGFAVWLLTI